MERKAPFKKHGTKKESYPERTRARNTHILAHTNIWGNYKSSGAHVMLESALLRELWWWCTRKRLRLPDIRCD